ncbi:MAG: TMEM175 family protein [Micromonosporaceae bacterium]
MFFSDAVIAIAMTLLALEVPLPRGEDDAALWRSFIHLFPEQYLTFALSFIVIAAYWTAHHGLFQRVARLAPGIVALNMLFLFAIVLLPFATRLVGEEGRSQVGTVCYAGVVAGVGVSLLLLLRQVTRRGVFHPDVPPSMSRDLAWRTVIVVGAFAASIPIAFVSTFAAKQLWLWLSVFGASALWASRRRRRASPRPAAQCRCGAG